MKKTIKIFSRIIIVLTLICIVTTTFVHAQNALPDVNSYEPGNEAIPTNFTNLIGIIAATIQVIGVVISVVILVMLGIKYMMGSVEEKADYKKSMIPFLIGAIFISATGTIVRIINNLVSQAVE